MNRKALLSILSYVSLLAGAHGASVSPEEARLAVENWLAEGDTLGCELGAVAGGAVEYSGAGGVGTFYVVPLQDAEGEECGYVAVSGDTMISPVIAFSDAGEFVASEENPLWLMLSGDIANSTAVVESNASHASSRLLALNASSASSAASAAEGNEKQWQRLLSRRTSRPLLKASEPSDLRVGKLLSSKWNQNKSIYGDYCYDYYTPNHYPCGCVATAFAQLLYFHKQPTGSVTTRWDYSGATDWEGGTWNLAQGTTLGPWKWSDMKDDPTSETARKAVGQLTWDLGRLCCMNYGPSSGAQLTSVRRRLAEEISYASSQAYHKSGGIDIAVLKKAVIPSLEAGLPVLFLVYNSSGGHAVVGDGYGYSGGGFYVHVNMGWGSTGNAWYQPPNIYDFTTLSQVIYNVYPSGVPYGTIVSGRVFNSGGGVASGKTVTARRASDGATFTASSNGKGVYALRLPADADYMIAAESGGVVGTRTIYVGHCVSVYIKANGIYMVNDGIGWSDWQDGQGEANRVANEYDVDLTINSLYPPTCSPASGTTFQVDNPTVALSCDTSGATIRYTTDGSDPTSSSAVYSGPIAIGVGTTTVKAKAFKSGCEPSETMTATFTLPAKVATPALSPVSALVEGTTTFLTRRFSFTLGCGTSGATIRYTLDGSDPTEQSPVYNGMIEIEGVVGEQRTVKVRAFQDGCRPSEVLSMTFVRVQPESWIDERPETHEGTGWWWPERTDFAADGRLHLVGDYDYHANEPSAERCVTIDSTISFDAPDEADGLRPDDDAKAAVRIGPEGGFQVFTSRSNGSREWLDVAATGVSAEANREYTFRFRLDGVNCVYTVAVVDDAVGEVPLKAGTRARFRFANGLRGSTSEISFKGSGRVSGFIGSCSDDKIQSLDDWNIILK